MNEGILTDMTVTEVRAFAPEVVLIPIGSTEPHGPSLPYGTDTFFVDAVAREATVQANSSGARVLMYPTLPVGNNVNFREFPFACRIKVRTLMHVLLDIVEALEEDGIRKIVILNGHGGNTATIAATLREHMERRPKGGESAFVCLAGQSAATERPQPVDIVHPSPHGGESEAARMLHLRPDLVRCDTFQSQPLNSPTIDRLIGAESDFVPPWHLKVPLSGGGDTREATAEKGKAIFENRVNGLKSLLEALSAEPWHRDFPYLPSTQTAE